MNPNKYPDWFVKRYNQNVEILDISRPPHMNNSWLAENLQINRTSIIHFFQKKVVRMDLMIRICELVGMDVHIKFKDKNTRKIIIEQRIKQKQS